MELSRIIIFTPDVERLVSFYETRLGLERIGSLSPGWAELGAGGATIAFHAIDERSTQREGWIKPVFGTTDVQGEKRRLEELGVEMSDIFEFEGIQLCDGTDPDGNRFQISSRGM